ncbi:hypothetical protein [Streptomyces sp. NPDC050856]|uniref:hypothetical protein n=1 Tax=Streptomyces sp. NPDC050856 TaxID=3154939 RepID=UPI0033E13098
MRAPYTAAYLAGHRAGGAVRVSGGKGAAVREAVWGGCARRALDAQAARPDRGAWVRGCLDGVAGRPERPPAATVTRRTGNPALLRGFVAWARANGAAGPAGHTGALVTVRLTDTDYDIELATDHPAGARGRARELAAVFAVWWDGDHGRDGRAWHVLVLAADGTRLHTARL